MISRATRRLLQRQAKLALNHQGRFVKGFPEHSSLKPGLIRRQTLIQEIYVFLPGLIQAIPHFRQQARSQTGFSEPQQTCIPSSQPLQKRFSSYLPQSGVQ